MIEEDLESFVTGETESISKVNDLASLPGSASSDIHNRPKLRKVKRPKIRPVNDVPIAPEKIMPQDDMRVNSALQEDISANNKLPNNIYDDDILSSTDGELSKSTDIIRAVDARELQNNSTEGNPYVLDGLPPDLDYENDEDYIDGYNDNGDYVKKNILYLAACACFFIGLFIGKTLFATQTIEKHGLEGVVTNPDVPGGRARCGLTDKSQACVFYVLNWYKQELNGRDFYKLAAQLTGREEYMIETDNLRYATVKIKPGQFAQLNIPALK